MKRTEYYLLLVYIFNKLMVAKLEYFTDKPPEDYYLRTNLADCPDRFYSGPPVTDPIFIFSGDYAMDGEFPHMAAIGWSTEENIKYLCGGSLLSSRFILTAAHCASNAEGFPPDTVRLGDIILGHRIFDDKSKQIKIKSIQRHPQHRFSRKYFDIAIIELEEEANIGPNVCPACLWLEKHAPSEPMSAIGYGSTGYGEDLSAMLLKATLSELNKKKCMERLPSNLRSLRDGLVEEQFCAANYYQDTCEGDSGGPLQVERIDFDEMVIPLIVGVVSFGTPCHNGSVGVYTRVASYKNWIEHVTGISFNYETCSRSSKCFRTEFHPEDIERPLNYQINRVGLLWNATDSNSYRCGATLIDYKFALTSAFCVNSKQGLPKFIAIKTGEIISIDKVHIHPMFTLDKPENDLALVELSKYLKNDNFLFPACLWRNENENDTFLNMRYSVHFENIYEEVFIRAYMDQNGKCSQQLYKERNLFCAINSVYFVPNVCKMDYGGPIYTELIHPKFIHSVISSFNKECDNVLVGTRIAPHIEWIEGVVLGTNKDRSMFSP